jgi:hypothetical protein
MLQFENSPSTDSSEREWITSPKQPKPTHACFSIRGPPLNKTRNVAGVVEVAPDALVRFFEVVLPHLNERQRRLVVGAAVGMCGPGTKSMVAEASGMREAGIEPSDRVRAPGAGVKPNTETQPDLLAALDELVHPGTRGNPMSLLRWTSKSTTNLDKDLVPTRHGGPGVGHLAPAETLAVLPTRPGDQADQHHLEAVAVGDPFAVTSERMGLGTRREKGPDGGEDGIEHFRLERAHDVGVPPLGRSWV